MGQYQKLQRDQNNESEMCQKILVIWSKLETFSTAGLAWGWY